MQNSLAEAESAPSTTIESLSQDIQVLESFLQTEDIDANFSSLLEQLEQKRTLLAALQAKQGPTKNADEHKSSNAKPNATILKSTLNASDYLNSSNAHIQSIATVILHYEQLIAMDRESPVRMLWEQMLAEKYQELETLLQGASVVAPPQTGNSDHPSKSISQENSQLLQQQIQDALEDGPEVYELLSVLVHSGSANGGHYYAFIKSFEDNLWYKFNDSSVSQISPDIVKNESFGDKSMGSAYMLVYSRITSDNLHQPIHVPESLKDAAFKEQQIETPATTAIHQPIHVNNNVGTRLAHASVDEEDCESDGVYESMDEDDSVEPFDFSDEDDIIQEIEFQVQFKELKKSFKVGKMETLHQATQKAYELLVSPFQRDFIPFNCVRLRLFDSLNSIPSRTTLDGKEHTTVSNLGFNSPKKFVLETCSAFGKFPQYGYDDWIIQIKQFLPEARSFSHSFFISVPHQASVAVLRGMIQEQLGIQINQQQLFVTLDRAPSVQLLQPNEDMQLLEQFGVVDGFTFYLEIVSPLQPFLESPAMRKLLDDVRSNPQHTPTKRKEPSLKFKSNV